MAAQGSHRLASPAATKEILDIIAVHAIATRHPPHHRKTRKMQCVACGKPTLMVCSACKITAYCSTECQATCWKTHYASCVHKPKVRFSPSCPSFCFFPDNRNRCCS